MACKAKYEADVELYPELIKVYLLWVFNSFFRGLQSPFSVLTGMIKGISFSF